jgi:Asp-tRNA(Asn)/Glu-tRNA(Gln) amidotransferase C subunit
VAVDTDTVREMAGLARLSLPEARLAEIAQEMGAILDFMGAIKAIDGGPAPPRPDACRRVDIATASDGSALITTATEHVEGQVVVPPIKDAS